MWLRRPRLAMIALVALTGCGQSFDLRSMPADAGPVEQYRLEVVGPQPLTLAPHGTASFQVLYVDPDGHPVQNAPVDFLLEIDQGSPGTDAVLTDLTAYTDALGLATGTVAAGSMAASFRVRASAEGAASVYVDVSVSDAGFGHIEATVSYTGARSPSAFTVVALGQTSCADARGRLVSVDRQEVVDAAAPTVTFASLPATLPYAVAAFVVSASDAVVGWGCVDGVTVEADATSQVMVVVEDLPLDPTGLYSGEALLSAPTAPATVETALANAATTVVSDLGGDAALLLADLATTAAAAGETACATYLSANLSTATTSVQAELDGAGTGVDESLTVAATTASANAGRLKVSGAVSITRAADGSLGVSYELTGLAVGPNDGSPLAPLNAAALGLDHVVTVDGAWSPDQRTFTVGAFDLPAPISAVATGLLELASEQAGAADVPAWLAQSDGCATFSASSTLTGEGCSAAMLEAVCADRMVQTLDSALSSVHDTWDAQRSDLALSGALTFTDANDDLVPESFGGSVSGAWTGSSAVSPDALTGALDGSRVGGVVTGP